MGAVSFKVAIFFLASAPFISFVFILLSSLIGSFLNKKNFFSDKWNLPLIISGILMLISCIFTTFFNNNEYTQYWDHSLSWIGLLNWLPFFWIFWALQPFLISPKDREHCAKLLIAGSIPVLLSCLFHYFLEWNGPYSILNGLIVWFQKPISPNEGVTGLFNNPNYTGSWLNIILPFLLASLLNNSGSKYSKIISLFLVIFSSIALFLTLSRNAWLGYLLSSILTLSTLLKFSKIKKILFILPIPIALIIYLLNNLNISILDLLINKLNRQFSSDYYMTLDMTRLNIWLLAMKFIIQRPFLGWGAASFPTLLRIDSDVWKGHAHNLFLEIGMSYGLPTLILIACLILFILYRSYKNILENNKFRKRFTKTTLFENAWFFSTIILIISQLFDVQYFDGRISLIFWILLAGLKNNIFEKKVNSKLEFK